MKAFATAGAVVDASGVTWASFEKRSVMTKILVEPFSVGGNGPKRSMAMKSSGFVAVKSFIGF